MFLNVYILALAVLLSQVNSNLIDDAKQELSQLKAIVQGAIFSGLDEIDRNNDEVVSYRDNSIALGILSIEEEYQNLVETLVLIKDLAQSAGLDIQTCLESYEPVLLSLNGTASGNLIDCSVVVDADLASIEADSRYKIDTLINEVGVYEFEIERCGTSVLCVEPILTQIELSMISLPQKIRIEVQKTVELFEILKISFQECTASGISYIALAGNDLIRTISYCVDHIDSIILRSNAHFKFV